jgi:hypothetical protein
VGVERVVIPLSLSKHDFDHMDIVLLLCTMRIAQIMKSAINLSVSTSHVDWRISTAATSANSSLKATKIKREKLSQVCSFNGFKKLSPNYSSTTAMTSKVQNSSCF